MEVSGQHHASGRFTPESKRSRYPLNMMLSVPREASFVAAENRNDSAVFKPVAQFINPYPANVEKRVSL
jgi:hypothetical protein